MGNILIFVILAVTIPRWAMTLAQVDTFGFSIGERMIAIAAIGEAVVLEFGNLYVLRTFTRCQREAFVYKAWWEDHDQSMKSLGKTNRKPPYNPKIRGFRILPVALLILEVLTLLAQTPFISGQLLGQPAVDLLNQWGTGWVWGYAFLLVISPGIMTIAIGFAINYADVIKEIEAKKEKVEIVPWHEHLRTWVVSLVRDLRALTARTPVEHRANSGRTVARGQPPTPPSERALVEQWAHTERTVGPGENLQPPTSPGDRTVIEQWADTERTDETEDEISQALAGHLFELHERLQDARQAGSANGTFRRARIEEMCGLSKTQALNVINYGLEHEILERSGKYEYRFTPK